MDWREYEFGMKNGLGWDGMDLPLIITVLRRDGLPLYPKGDGMELSPILWDGVVEFAANGLYHGLMNGNGRLA